MISEEWNGKDVKENGDSLSYYANSYLAFLRKTHKMSVKTVSALATKANSWSEHLQYTSRNHYHFMLLIPLCTSHMNNNTVSQTQLINTLFKKEHLHVSHNQGVQ